MDRTRKLVGIGGSAWLDCLTLSLLRCAASGGGVGESRVSGRAGGMLCRAQRGADPDH